MRDARWLQASRPAAQAAQVAENTLLRDGIVTSDPSAACASVVACCAPHGRLLEAFQLGRFQFAHGIEHVACPRARLWHTQGTRNTRVAESKVHSYYSDLADVSGSQGVGQCRHEKYLRKKLEAKACTPWRSVFNLSVSGRPRGSEPVGRREKQKTKNRGPEGGPGPQGPSGLGPRWVGRVGGRWVGGPVGWSTGQVGRVDQWGGRGGWGWLYCCLGGQNA